MKIFRTKDGRRYPFPDLHLYSLVFATPAAQKRTMYYQIERSQVEHITKSFHHEEVEAAQKRNLTRPLKENFTLNVCSL